MYPRISLLIAILVATAIVCKGKVFSKCEFARTMVRHGIPKSQIPHWVCLAQHESRFNTRALNSNKNGSKDHGIFQVNDQYWCAPPGPHNDCKMSCSALRNDNISDDIACAKIIYRRHKFSAWVAWTKHCKGRNLSGYVKGCRY